MFLQNDPLAILHPLLDRERGLLLLLNGLDSLALLAPGGKRKRKDGNGELLRIVDASSCPVERGCFELRRSSVLEMVTH